MPDDANSAMIAGWCERMDGAFEAIKGMRLAAHRDLKRLVVVVAAGFTRSHMSSSADMSQMHYIEVCKWRPVPTAALLTVETSIRDTAARPSPWKPRRDEGLFSKVAPGPK